MQRKRNQFEYCYLVQFVFEKPYFSQNSLSNHRKCCISLLLRSSIINYSPLYFHFQPLLEERKLCILGLKSLPKEKEGTHKFPYFSQVLSIQRSVSFGIYFLCLFLESILVVTCLVQFYLFFISFLFSISLSH